MSRVLVTVNYVAKTYVIKEVAEECFVKANLH